MRSLIVLSLLFMMSGCGQQPLSKQVFSGTLEITEHLLGPKVSGRVVTLLVKEGSKVKAGDVIATLDRFEQAKKDYERTQKIYKQGGSNLQTLEFAQLAMEDQQIIAPIDSEVLIMVQEIGEMVSAGSPVVVVGDYKDPWVKIYVPEGVVNQIQLEQPVELSFDSLKKKYRGHVRYISPKAEFTPRNVQTPEERVTQAFAIKIAIDEQDLYAHPGVAVDVRFRD